MLSHNLPLLQLAKISTFGCYKEQIQSWKSASHRDQVERQISESDSPTADQQETPTKWRSNKVIILDEVDQIKLDQEKNEDPKPHTPQDAGN